MSRTKAINDKCKDCIYDPAVGGTWREQVQLCTSEKSCALWPYRPKTTKAVIEIRQAKAAGIDHDAILATLDDEEEEETVAA
jgi:hypothetical protein